MRLTFLTLCLCLLSAPVCAGELTVFAGSASQPPLQELAALYQERTGTRVNLHLGGSGAMLSQIRLTGTGDLYIPGSPDFMARARQFDLVDKGEEILAYLLPAVVVAKGNPAGIHRLKDLARPGLRVGIANPDGVCVGLYGVEVLEKNGLLQQVRANIVGMVDSCARAASLVPLRQVDAVLGWRVFGSWDPEHTDVVLLRPDQVVRVATIPGAVVRGSRNKALARDFLHFLSGAEGKAVFRRWGYLTDEDQVRHLAPNAVIGGDYVLPEGWR